MASKTHLVIFVSILSALLCAVIIYGVAQTKGWDSPVRNEYSPALKVQPSEISEITVKRLCSWEKCPVFTLSLRGDGYAEYTGVRNVKMIGTFRGITKEFPTLAGWIQSLGLAPFQQKCMEGEIAVTLVVRGKATTYVTCNPNQDPIEFRMALQAIEDVGSRVDWQK